MNISLEGIRLNSPVGVENQKNPFMFGICSLRLVAMYIYIYSKKCTVLAIGPPPDMSYTAEEVYGVASCTV